MSIAGSAVVAAATFFLLRLAGWLGWVFVRTVHEHLHAEAEAEEPPTEASAIGFHMESVPLDEQDDSPEELP